MSETGAIRPMKDVSQAQQDVNRLMPWRNEKVLVARATGNKRSARATGNKWIVEPACKVATQGQTVTFEGIGAKQLELRYEGNIFADVTPTNNGAGCTAKVTGTRGYYTYAIIVDGKFSAIGGSDPKMIID